MIRLNKFLSEAGICSRREADKLIAAGAVKVDGKVAELGMQVAPGMEIRVGKKIVPGTEAKVVLAYYKPVGVVVTEDRRERRNVIRALDYPTRVTYAGRLDKDSEGLLLMTNDGQLINDIMRARNVHEKEYKVTVDRELTDEFLQQLRAGVHITDAEKQLDAVTRPAVVGQIGKYTFRIVLTQGLNRQIRRMCEACGYLVKRLVRTRVMNIELGRLRPGQYRKIEGQELERLYADSQTSTHARTGHDPE